jgi:hypothetical protein
MKSYPVVPDELSARWLTEVMGFRVHGFEVNYFSEGAGVMAMVTRVVLETDDGNANSVIVKFPSPSADNRRAAQSYNMYQREVQFYQDIAESVSLNTPTCYFGAFDPTNHDFVLVLEDIGHLRIGDQVAGCTIEEARSVIRAIARLHADGWQATQFPGLISHNNPMQRQGMIAGFQLGWPVVLEQFSDLVSPAARAAAANFPDAIPGLMAQLSTDPICLTHADVRLDNVFFSDHEEDEKSDDENDDEVVLIDWQSVCTSAPEQDLAYFVTQSVKPEVRADEDLVAYYHAELTKLGVEYSLDSLRERYRACSLYLLCYAVVIAGTLDLANERGAALGRTLLRNCLEALEELGAFALLK